MQHINGAPFRVLPTVGRAFVTGSFLQEALESTLQTTSSQLTVSVFDDTFYGTASSFPSIVFGSLGLQTGSWESVVQAALSNVVLTPHTIGNGVDITVDIPQSIAYQISEPETISVVIPSSFVRARPPNPAPPASTRRMFASPSPTPPLPPPPHFSAARVRAVDCRVALLCH